MPIVWAKQGIGHKRNDRCAACVKDDNIAEEKVRTILVLVHTAPMDYHLLQ